MKEKFLQKMNTLSISKQHKIVVGVSGGIDSMVLIHLLHYFNFSFLIAHCNFLLRGHESDNDELLVHQVANNMNVQYNCKKFKTDSYAKDNKVSIQMAARDLRYSWFEELKKENDCKFIATAHHANDSAETLLINLIRGTGLAGFHGIKSKEDIIIRPLIDFYKEDIIGFAKHEKITYREDSSNLDSKYIRNNIRHSVIPNMQLINPSVVKSIVGTISMLSNVEELYREMLVEKKNQVIFQSENEYIINIDKLLIQKYPKQLLYELISDFGFTDLDSVFHSLQSSSGKEFFSEEFYMIKDRAELIISKHITGDIVKIDNHTINIKKPFSVNFEISKADMIKPLDFISDDKTIYIDYDKLEFPLIIRPFQIGDRFIPLGMNNKKKISDYFIDNKFSLVQKKRARLLISNNTVVCIIGHRLDDRFKLVEKTKKVYIVKS